MKTQNYAETESEDAGPMTKTERFFATLIWGFIIFGSVGFWVGLVAVVK